MIRVNYSYTPQRCHSFLHILLAVVFRSEANYHLLERRQIPQAQLEISDAASYFSRLAHSHTGNVRSRSVSLGMAPCQNTTGGVKFRNLHCTRLGNEAAPTMSLRRIPLSSCSTDRYRSRRAGNLPRIWRSSCCSSLTTTDKMERYRGFFLETGIY